MSDFRDVLDTLLADRPKGADGRPLCTCGATLDRDRFVCPACLAADDERRRQEKAKEAAAGLRARAERGARTAPDWEPARLDSPNFDRCVADKAFRTAAARWVPDRGNLTLIGETGTGKTTASIRILWRLAEAAIAACYEQRNSRPTDFVSRMFWVPSYELVRARKEHPLGQGEAPLVERAMDATVLALDDLGNEPSDTVIFEIVDHRYRQGDATIVTTGLRPHQLRERYGDALWRRLSERGAVLEARSA